MPHSPSQPSGSATPDTRPEPLQIADLQSRIETLLGPPTCHDSDGAQPRRYSADYEAPPPSAPRKFGQADDEIRMLLADIKNKYIPLGLVSGDTLQRACTLVGKAEELAVACAGEPVAAEDVSEVIWQAEQGASGEEQQPIEMVDSDAVRAELFALCRVIARFDTAGREAVCRGKRLLSFDGGGVRGICSLMMLQALMRAVQAVEEGRPHFVLGEDWEEDDGLIPSPVQYFDLVGGTSAGGLIALMLFRLGMSIPRAKEEFCNICNTVFKKSGPWGLGNKVKVLLKKPMYNASDLEAAIDSLVRIEGVSDIPLETPERERGYTVPTFVCAVSKNTKHAVNFRTYEVPRGAATPCTITQAGLATSAAPFYFAPAVINNVTFWDGGLQNNNPVGQLLAEFSLINPPVPLPPNANDDEAGATYAPMEQRLPAIVVSLGTGRTSEDEALERVEAKLDTPSPRPEETSNIFPALLSREDASPASDGIVGNLRAVIGFVTHGQNVHTTFNRILNGVPVCYHRLNPTFVGGKQIELDNCERIEALKNITREYLRSVDVQKRLEDVARVIARKPRPQDPVGAALRGLGGM